jgi:hypothetical protein
VGTNLICMQVGEGSRKRKREEVEPVPPPIQEDVDPVPPPNQEEEVPVPPPIQEEEEPVPAPAVAAPPVPAPPVPAPAVPAPPVPGPYEELEKSDGSLEVSYIILFSTLFALLCILIYNLYNLVLSSTTPRIQLSRWTAGT